MQHYHIQSGKRPIIRFESSVCSHRVAEVRGVKEYTYSKPGGINFESFTVRVERK